MTRLLPILGVQAPSRVADDNLQGFEHELLELLTDFKQTILIVYPENHLCDVHGGPEQRLEQLETVAQPRNGPLFKRLGEISQNLGVWLIPGTVCERGEDGALYNTTPVFSPQGKLVATYRKCFPWRPYEPYKPGRQFTVFDIPDVGRFGLAVCYDIWYPEVVRQLAWMGAEVIINPVQTSTCDRAQEQILVRANAIFNQVFVVSINASIPSGIGQSLIVDPEGHIKSHLSGETSVILSDVINLDEVDRIRHFGTAGLTRPWSQFREDDQKLDLSVYHGCINPLQWKPDKRRK